MLLNNSAPLNPTSSRPLDLAALTAREKDRQRTTLNLIASENYPSPAVLDLLGSVWSTKYAEGQPGKRYYAGNVLADDLERYTMQLALDVFDARGYGCNVQVLSGSPANATVYHACLEPGDRVFSLSLDDGGHLSHLHQTSVYNKYYRFAHYALKSIGTDSFEVDEQDYIAKLKDLQPKLVILGFSSYPRHIDFAKFIRLAHEQGALVLTDVAHINGLIAAGLHSSPFADSDSGADFVTMTTHKTLRGPRGGLVFAKTEHMKAVNKAIFPGSFGGPHLQKIAALAQALQEIKGLAQYPDGRSFGEYSAAVLDNCHALEQGLADAGLQVVSPTGTHLCLIRLPQEHSSLALQRALETSGIITNRNKLPRDPKSAWDPSGMRFGTAALTSRGATVEDMQQIARWITAHVFESDDEAKLTAIREDIRTMAERLAWYY